MEEEVEILIYGKSADRETTLAVLEILNKVLPFILDNIDIKVYALDENDEMGQIN